MKYRYKGSVEVLVPELGLTVQPGDIVEADHIENESFEPVGKADPKPAAPAKEAA